MNKTELLDKLQYLYPSFTEWWNSKENYNLDGDDFSIHGLCAEFSSFFIERSLPLERHAVEVLFGFVEQQVAADPHDKSEIANALYTCFLENIAQTTIGQCCRPFMGKNSRAYFDQWHVSQ
jgi:hypothetical protein